jgi:hypothetical protein
MNAHKSPRTLEAAEALYAELQAQGLMYYLMIVMNAQALNSLT